MALDPQYIALIIYASIYVVLFIFIGVYVYYARKKQEDSKEAVNKLEEAKRQRVETPQSYFEQVWYAREIYTAIIVHLYDQATDIAVMYQWGQLTKRELNGENLESVNMLTFFIPGIAFIMLYRFITMAFALYEDTRYGRKLREFKHNEAPETELEKMLEPFEKKSCLQILWDMVLALFDLYFLKVVYDEFWAGEYKPNVKHRSLQLVEALFESMPQVVLQTVFLLRYTASVSAVDDTISIGLIVVSIAASILSIANKYAWFDQQAVVTIAKEFNGGKRGEFYCSWRFIVRSVWRWCDLCCRFVIFSLLWVIIGGAYILVYAAASYLFYYFIVLDRIKMNEANFGTACWRLPFASLESSWIGSGIEANLWYRLLATTICIVGIILDWEWHFCILRLLDHGVMMIIIAVVGFVTFDFDCPKTLCSDNAKRDVWNVPIIQVFILLGLISYVIEFITYMIIQIKWFGIIKQTLKGREFFGIVLFGDEELDIPFYYLTYHVETESENENNTGMSYTNTLKVLEKNNMEDAEKLAEALESIFKGDAADLNYIISSGDIVINHEHCRVFKYGIQVKCYQNVYTKSKQQKFGDQAREFIAKLYDKNGKYWPKVVELFHSRFQPEEQVRMRWVLEFSFEPREFLILNIDEDGGFNEYGEGARQPVVEKYRFGQVVKRYNAEVEVFNAHNVKNLKNQDTDVTIKAIKRTDRNQKYSARNGDMFARERMVLDRLSQLRKSASVEKYTFGQVVKRYNAEVQVFNAHNVKDLRDGRRNRETDVTIKAIKRNHNNTYSTRNEDLFARERMVLDRLSQTSKIGILPYMGWDDSYDTFYIVTKRLFGDKILDRVTSQKRKMTEKQLVMYIRDMFEIVSVVHSNDIAMRNLSLNNFQFESNDDSNTNRRDNVLYLTHYEGARMVENSDEPKYGNLSGKVVFLSPELCQVIYRRLFKTRKWEKDISGKMYMASDVWALGIVAYYLVTGHHPFYTEKAESNKLKRTLNNIINHTIFDFEAHNIDPFHLQSTNKLFQDFLNRVLCKDYKKRATVQEALDDPFLSPDTIEKLDGNQPIKDEILTRLRRTKIRNKLHERITEIRAKQIARKEEIQRIKYGDDGGQKQEEQQVAGDAIAASPDLAGAGDEEEEEKQAINAGNDEEQEMVAVHDSDLQQLQKTDTQVLRIVEANMQEEMEKQFKRMDLDGDGYTTVDELVGLLTSMKFAKSYARTEAERIMKELDENGDGVIDFKEFSKAWVAKALTIDQEYAQQIFDAFDENGDGFIDIDELRHILFPDGEEEEDDAEQEDMDDEDDADLDKLTGAECTEAAKQQSAVKTAELIRTLKQLDENGDEKISFDEFLKAMGNSKDGNEEQEDAVPFLAVYNNITFREINADGMLKAFEDEADYITLEERAANQKAAGGAGGGREEHADEEEEEKKYDDEEDVLYAPQEAAAAATETTTAGDEERGDGDDGEAAIKQHITLNIEGGGRAAENATTAPQDY
eukprot:CAMPEP_0197079898 /NCGR_PEP_ID=MMETSP1384-20130603/213849_1 /TAXON_ID=29189 /ORGANISM="Ammonia sp." /LENGTH=1483 /DNA_ID=CAMNT_0042518779 /DNA_START=94 /DNA_END=4547 /DNA_ORIENTATION=-